MNDVSNATGEQVSHVQSWLSGNFSFKRGGALSAARFVPDTDECLLSFVKGLTIGNAAVFMEPHLEIGDHASTLGQPSPATRIWLECSSDSRRWVASVSGEFGIMLAGRKVPSVRQRFDVPVPGGIAPGERHPLSLGGFSSPAEPFIRRGQFIHHGKPELYVVLTGALDEHGHQFDLADDDLPPF